MRFILVCLQTFPLSALNGQMAFRIGHHILSILCQYGTFQYILITISLHVIKLFAIEQR